MEEYKKVIEEISSFLTKKEIINLIKTEFNYELSTPEFNKLIKFYLSENILVKYQEAKGSKIKYISTKFNTNDSIIIDIDEKNDNFNKKDFKNLIKSDSINEICLEDIWEISKY